MGWMTEQTGAERWLPACIAGLVTSTFSTLAIILAAPRIGRNGALSWMEVATVLLRDRAIRVRPSAREFLAGVLVHQFADFAWAFIFFGLGARWSHRLRPRTLATLAPPWAALTSAIEYYLILPWLQPLLRMQAPYWIGLAAHIASGAAYPLFPWLKQRYLNRKIDGASEARQWALGLAGASTLLGFLALRGEAGSEARWPFGSQEARQASQTFLRHMTAHHQVGIRMIQLAIEKGSRRDFQKLNELMLAQHVAEVELMCRWWRSWYGEEMAPITPAEYSQMAGMPKPSKLRELEQLEALAFERRYLPLMISHHEGAIKMSNRAWKRSHDPRVRLLADQIRHTQLGQINFMEALRRTLPKA